MKQLLSTFILICTSFWAFAQTIDGKIVDKNNRPIEDVFVYSLIKNQHTHTDIQGMFSIKDITLGDTLVIEGFGFKTKYIAVEEGMQENLLISLSQLSVTLDQVSITPGSNFNDQVTRIDLSMKPVSSSQELLPIMPGLIIGQHAGGGKAEQIFLRGFDIDHGTDLRISVDGMPVNMVSHAHGQGYADLHFVIPETVDRVSFEKGPYDAAQGNFATAGNIAFETKDHIDQSQVIQEVGQFNTWRSVVLLNLINKENNSAYLAGEFRKSDGPFVSSQDFSRINALGKWSFMQGEKNHFTISASGFTSTWLASGQVPQRAVDAGLITRFGAIDDTEGGTTSRYNAKIEHKYISSGKHIFQTDYWYSRYIFDLYSNFTFFLDDAVNGDQIRQKEKRDLFGINSKWSYEWKNDNYVALSQAGLITRTDLSYGNGLLHTLNRQTVLSTSQLGDNAESSVGVFAKQLFEIKRWTVEAGARVDYFNAFYKNYKGVISEHAIDDVIFSPSVSVSFNPTDDVQLYGKIGKGFHSNDARIAIFDERSYLTGAIGGDLGIVYKLSPKLLIDAAVWQLNMAEEMVYVGDAGVVEPSGRSKRYGVDLGLRFAPFEWMQMRLDGNYTVGRSLDDSEGENFIPLAPRFTSVATLSVKHPKGVKANLSYRFVGDRPANEDNSIVAKGYFVTDFNAVYTWKKFDIGFVVENLLNTKWNETQFATESRLFNEPESVEEIHFIPGTPFNIRAKVGFRF